MQSLLYESIKNHLPFQRRQNAKGWQQFNAVCCHHRGHQKENRGRGNLLFSIDGNIVYNCYNCGFKTGYSGGQLGSQFEHWLSWLGISQEVIQKIKLELLSKQLNGDLPTSAGANWLLPTNFPEVELPVGSRLVIDGMLSGEPPHHMIEAFEYLSQRGRAVLENWEYFWAPNISGIIGRKISLHRRIIIPFKHRNKIVGWTARYCGMPPKGIPKYYNSAIPPGYLFNGDVITKKNRKFVLIHEGPFDAIATDGVGALGSTMNKSQIAWLNSTDCEKIVVPDRQGKNQDLIDIALDQGWSVSFPEWSEKIKDAADASKLYGRLYTVYSILNGKTSSQLKIGVQRKMLKDR